MKKPLVVILSILGVLLLIGIGIFIYFKITYLSETEIKEIVIRDSNVERDNIHFTNIDLDTEENLYEVEFYYVGQNTEYEYKINAKTGQIIYSNFNSSKNNENTKTNNTNNNSNSSSSNEITLDEAKKIALDDSKLNENDVIYTETKTDFDDNQKIYDIEFIYNNQEYNYEIDATTGEIIGYDKDNIR